MRAGLSYYRQYMMPTEETDTGGKHDEKVIKTAASKGYVNEEIESIKPYRFRPFWLHLNIGPFFAAYIIWFLVWTQYLGVEV